jgi:hypothetical protein
MKRNLVLMLAFLFVLTSSTFGAYQVYYDETAADIFIPSFPGQVDLHMKFDCDDTLTAMVDPFTWAGSSAGVSLVVKACTPAGWFAGSALNVFDSKLCGAEGLVKYHVSGLRFVDPNALVMPGTNQLLAVWSFNVTNENDIICMDSTFMTPSRRLKWVNIKGAGIFPFIAPQKCWTIKKIPNLPPTCTCPAGPIVTYHSVVAFDLTANDPDGSVANVTVSPVGAVAFVSGNTWHYNFDFDGYALGTVNLIFTVTDNLGGTGTCTTVVDVKNRPPDITNCPTAPETAYKDVEFCYTFTVTELDGDPLAWTASVGSFVGNKWCYTFTTSGDYTVTVIVSDTYLTADTCIFSVHVPSTIPYGGTATIGIPPCANPGDAVLVPITINTMGWDPIEGYFKVGGFELEIEFDPTTLYFLGATPGSALVGWDYFTYRQLPCPSCGCCKYKLELVGIADMPGGNTGDRCLPQNVNNEIAVLKFTVANDNNLRGLCLPICFEFESEICTENVFSDCTGNLLFVAKKLFRSDCLGGFIEDTFGYPLFPEQGCPPHYAGTHVKDVVNFYCGGVLVCPAGGPCVIGDINLNGVKYEVADAVLFARYFTEGLGVFHANADERAQQIAATDVNRDGRTLSISDLVYLVRVILKDAVALPKLTPYVNTLALTNTAGVISANTEIPVGAALFVFKGVGTPTLLAGSMEMLYANNGTETRVLVWSTNGNSFSSGDVISISGNIELVAVEAADHIGNALNTTLSKGVAKADAFELKAAYPNPFNLRTTIEFAIKTDAKVSLKVYNVSGQYVKTLVDEEMSAGRYTTTWDGTNYAGEVVSSGIYFYKMVAGNYSSTQKMVLLK